MAVQLSATKPQYMHSLGLNPNVQAHRNIYVTMRVSQDSQTTRLRGAANLKKNETSTAHLQLISTRANLRADLVNNQTVQPPYSYGQMNPLAINQTIQQIWTDASQTTRRYYDLGSALNAEAYNWAIRWLLYKRFRYTDRRNQRNPPGGYDDDNDDDDDDNDGDGPATGEFRQILSCHA